MPSYLRRRLIRRSRLAFALVSGAAGGDVAARVPAIGGEPEGAAGLVAPDGFARAVANAMAG
ncbi:hypothetical protein [Streptomyces inhibens]|uniref:hypothetical protein n=1 Tax=Streptomyces inhibens TaxID=2293571 RepID=UPI001EE7790B|nr:hypothetical protein [Streptomyces inhibens]UKY54884.1 hypothetical protein KI385_43080 [Streptomyces inhibens]